MVCVLAAHNAWQNGGTRWTDDKVQFEAVYAEHPGDASIGVIIR